MLCDLCKKEERVGQLLCATCLETIERLGRVTGFPFQKPKEMPTPQIDGPSTNLRGLQTEKYFEAAASISASTIPGGLGGSRGRKGMLSVMFEESHVREWAYRGCACKGCQEERSRNMKLRLGLGLQDAFE